jgi:MYXO-CTERM domain-containing protein
VGLEDNGLDVLSGAFSAAGQDGLLVVSQGSKTARLRPHHALLAPQASAFPAASLPLEREFRAGLLSQNGTDGLADVASHYAVPLGASQIQVVFGSDPGNVHAFDLGSPTDFGAPPSGPPYVVSFLTLLAKTPRAQQLVLPYCLEDVCGAVFLVDFDPAALPSATTRVLSALDLEPMETQPEAFPVWLSTTARSAGLDDVAIGSFGTVLLYAQRSASATLAALDLADPVAVGTTRHVGLPLPTWLPPTVPRFSEVHGVASLDVDRDGQPDLVFAMSTPTVAAPGSLLWVKGTGSPADFANPLVSTWHDLGLTLGLPDPMTVRPLRVGGSPAVAVWDRTLQEILVVTSSPSAGLSIWRAPAPGVFAKDIRLAELVGSPARDLVVVMDQGAAPTTVLVYADLGLPAPALAWAPGSPGTPARGAPHSMAVVLDPGGPSTVTVEWIQGVPTSAPVGTGLDHVFPPDCSMPPPPFSVLVRATDDTGQFDELSVTTTVAVLAPAVTLAGSSPPGRLVLAPGGTTAVLDGVAATGCGVPSWSGTWPAAATVVDAVGPTWVRRTVTLPEAAYPELLADPAFTVSLATTDPAFPQEAAALALAMDGTGLVELSHASDRAALADGELAVVRTRLRSRLSVPLPGVRVNDALLGLAPAGAPSVTGAGLLSSGAGGTDVVLDALPPAGGEVTIVLPVRGTGAPGGSYVEARSSAGWPLSPEGHGQTASVKPPGCGCGTGSGPGSLALGLAALALRPRRRRPPPT